MLVNRLTKYIELDTVELQDINFLSEMPDKTEKGELNCSLCHTLSHIFYIYFAVDGLHQQLPEQLAAGADHHHAPDTRRDHVLRLRGRVRRIRWRLVRGHEAATGARGSRGLDKR